MRSAQVGSSLHRALAASAADRNPGRDYLFFLLVSITRPLGATPLRRDGSAAAGAVPGRRPLRGLESAQDRPPGRGAQCAFTASHECDHHRVTSLRTLVMGSLIILIGYTHISTTTAALGHLSQASAAHDQTDRPPREAATDGICDQPRPQYAFGADQSTHQLISIAQFHAMPVGCFHRLQRQPHRVAPPRPASRARS